MFLELCQLKSGSKKVHILCRTLIIAVLLVIVLPVLEGCAPTTAPEETAPALEETSAPAPEELLEKVRFIAKVKNSLLLEQRGNLNTYGVYVQSGRNVEPTLPKEGILYMVGGVTLPKLIQATGGER